MKKNLLFTALAATTLLFATSCQQDEVFVDGNESIVTFEVGTPQMATRANYSDGMTATKLQWAVYNEDNTDSPVMREGTQLSGETTLVNGKASVNIQLAAGKNYNVLFWAEAEGAPYDVTFATKELTVNYDNAKSNDEKRDAFYCYHPVQVEKANKTETVVLRRPFAQLNIGTNDLDKLDGVSAEFTQVTVPVYSTLNLATGTVVGTTADKTFAFAARPQGQTFPVADYEYLAMNYLLVGKDKAVVDVTFSYDAAADATAKPEYTRTYTGIPVQANYRTNIYGSLLTQGIDFDVTIEPDYNEPSTDKVYEYYEQDGAFVVLSANGLKQLAEHMNNESELLDENIILAQDIDLSVVTRATTSNWTPIGTAEKPFTGIFDGNGYSIKNLNIIESEAKEGKAYIGFIGYAQNATIKNVTFENVNLNIPCLDIDHSQGHIGAVAGSLEGTSTIENVTVKGDIKVEATFDANGASRVAVVAGGNSYGNVTMRNVHVIANDGSYLKANNNVGALAGQLQGQSVFENCSSNIDVTGKKFFAGGIIGLAAGNQVFTNCHTTGDITITAGREGRAHDQYRVGGIAGGWADNVKTPCVLTNCSYTGTISGTNADGSVATPLDYLGYVGRGYTLAGCQGSTVIIDGISFVQKYNTADEAGKYDATDAEGKAIALVTTFEELNTALTSGSNVILQSDVTYDKAYDLKKDVTIDLNGNSLEISNPDLMFSIHSKATIKNGTLKGKVYARKNADIAFEAVTFGGTISGGGSTEGLLQIQGTCNVYAKDCIFNATNDDAQKTRPLSVEGRSSGMLKFENCSFKSNTNQNQVYVNALSGTATLEFLNCNFNNKTPNVVLAATCPFTNVKMNGTTKLTSVTLEISRAKEAVTADDLAYLREMIANNSFNSVRVFYAGGSSEYIR